MSNFEAELKLLMRLVVMGVDIQKEEITHKSIHEGKVIPTFLNVYPSFGDAKPPAYMENFKIWGFVDGFKIYDEKLRVLNDEEEGEEDCGRKRTSDADGNPCEDIKNKTKIYSFVMTDSNCFKRYCTTLHFHERYYVKRDHVYSTKTKESTLMPKTSLQELFKYPYTMNDHDLVYLPKSITLISPIPCFDTQKQILLYFQENLFKKDNSQSIQPERSIRIPKTYIEQLDVIVTKKRKEKTETDLDAKWSKIYDSNANLDMKGAKKHEEILVKEIQLREFYVSALFSLLDLSNAPVERVVNKLHNESPDMELVRYRVNKSMGIDLPMTGFKGLFRKLSPKNIVKIFRALLLEKHVWFFSSSPGEIANITEAFMSLLSPLMWCCIYIPYLPLSLWEVIHAIMPVIVGFDKEHKEFIENMMDSGDKVVVDLDNDTVQWNEEHDVKFPRNAHEYLITKLEELSKVIKNIENKRSKETWVDVTLKCRHYFNTFLLNIFNNIIPFFRPLETQIQKFAASMVFDFDKYYAQFPDSESSQFANTVAQTMMFSHFIEESYIILNACDFAKTASWEDQVDEISHFLQQLRQLNSFLSKEKPLNTTFLPILSPKSLSYIEINNAYPIQQATQRYLSPEKIDLLPYLVKFYYRFFYDKARQQQIIPSLVRVNQPLHVHTSLSPNPVFRNPGSPLAAEGSFSGVSHKEAQALNRGAQFFPPLNPGKLVDLKEILNDDFLVGNATPPAKETKTKPPIFELKPSYEPKMQPDDIFKILETPKHAGTPTKEPQLNSPANLLRDSNYFLYYQLVKRNEVKSEDVRRASDFEKSIISPLKKSQYLRLSQLGRPKISIGDLSPNTKDELGLNSGQKVFGWKRKSEEIHGNNLNFEFNKAKQEEEEPVTPKIGELAGITRSHSDQQSSHSPEKPSRGVNSLQNKEHKERYSPVSKTMEKQGHQSDRKERKWIFEPKDPVPVNLGNQKELLLKPLQLNNRSHSASPYQEDPQAKTSKKLGKISIEKEKMPNGDLGPSPTSSNQLNKGVFEGLVQDPIVRAFSAEDYQSKQKKEVLAEKHEDVKIEDSQQKCKVKKPLFREEDVMIRNLDTGEMVPISEVLTFQAKLRKPKKENIEG